MENNCKSADSFDLVYFRSIICIMSQLDKPDDYSDGSVLFDAIRKGKQHLARFILEASPVNVANARDFKGKTPLIVATSIKEEFHRSSVTRLLLFHGADVNLQDDHGRSPLSFACEKRCNDLIEIFVKQRNINPDLVDEKGNSPLMYCAMVGNDIGTNILVRYFRRLGLKIDIVNKEGYTPLVVAAKNGYITCARILFQQGQASVIARDPTSHRTVEELLEKNGYTIEDILPFSRQLEARRRFNKMITLAKFAKGLDSAKVNERGRMHRGSIGLEYAKRNERGQTHRGSFGLTDIVPKSYFPLVHGSQIRQSACVLPPVKSNCQMKGSYKERSPFKVSSKSKSRETNNPSVGNHIRTGIIPAIGPHSNYIEDNVREFHNVGIQAWSTSDRSESSNSDDSSATDCIVMSEKEEESENSKSESTFNEEI